MRKLNFPRVKCRRFVPRKFVRSKVRTQVSPCTGLSGSRVSSQSCSPTLVITSLSLSLTLAISVHDERKMIRRDRLSRFANENYIHTREGVK